MPFLGKDSERYQQLRQKLDKIRGTLIQHHLIYVQFPEVHQFIDQGKQIP